MEADPTGNATAKTSCRLALRERAVEEAKDVEEMVNLVQNSVWSDGKCDVWYWETGRGGKKKNRKKAKKAKKVCFKAVIRNTAGSPHPTEQTGRPEQEAGTTSVILFIKQGSLTDA